MSRVGFPFIATLYSCHFSSSTAKAIRREVDVLPVLGVLIVFMTLFIVPADRFELVDLLADPLLKLLFDLGVDLGDVLGYVLIDLGILFKP